MTMFQWPLIRGRTATHILQLASVNKQ